MRHDSPFIPTLTLASCLIFVGCALPGDDDPPGDLVGTFNVLSVVSEHTCGNDAIPDSGGTLVADLWRDDRDVFWQTQSGSLVAGTFIESEFRFRAAQTLVIEGSDPRFANTCIVSRTDSISFRLEDVSDTDDPDAPKTLAGNSVIEFAPVAGSDCRYAVVAGGGMFVTLPCRVEHTLEGETVAGD